MSASPASATAIAVEERRSSAPSPSERSCQAPSTRSRVAAIRPIASALESSSAEAERPRGGHRGEPETGSDREPARGETDRGQAYERIVGRRALCRGAHRARSRIDRSASSFGSMRTVATSVAARPRGLGLDRDRRRRRSRRAPPRSPDGRDRSVYAPAGAAPATAAERPRPQRKVPTAAALRAAWSFAQHRAGIVSFAVVDSEGKLRGRDENRRYAAASVVKAMLLAAEIRRLKHAGQGIDPATDSLLRAMITRSDNDAADSIYARVGDPGLFAVAKRARMSRFTVAGHWGNAQIAAGDMARFFGDLDRVLARRHREYAKGLLGSVIESQRWGIPPAAERGLGGPLQGRLAARPRARPSGRRAARARWRPVAVDRDPHRRPALVRVRDRDGARGRRAVASSMSAAGAASSGLSPSRGGAWGDRSGSRRGARPAAGSSRLVGAVGDDLGAQRAAHARELGVHPALELGGALAHPRHLRARPLELALEPEHGLDPGQVQALVGGHPLDPAQPLDVLVGVEPRVLRRALRRDQPARLVHPQRLRVHLGELGGDRDHEHAAPAVEPVGPAAGGLSASSATVCGGHLAQPTFADEADASRSSRSRGSWSFIASANWLSACFCSWVRSRGISTSSR